MRGRFHLPIVTIVVDYVAADCCWIPVSRFTLSLRLLLHVPHLHFPLHHYLNTAVTPHRTCHYTDITPTRDTLLRCRTYHHGSSFGCSSFRCVDTTVTAHCVVTFWCHGFHHTRLDVWLRSRDGYGGRAVPSFYVVPFVRIFHHRLHG